MRIEVAIVSPRITDVSMNIIGKAIFTAAKALYPI
jgi:hypothetical protein